MKKYAINLLLATVLTAGPLFAMESEEGDRRSVASSTSPSAMETELSPLETLDIATVSGILNYLEPRECLSLRVISKSMQRKIEGYKEGVISQMGRPEQYPDSNNQILHAIHGKDNIYEGELGPLMRALAFLHPEDLPHGRVEEYGYVDRARLIVQADEFLRDGKEFCYD